MYRNYKMNSNGQMIEFKFRTTACATKWADEIGLNSLTLHMKGGQLKLAKNRNNVWFLVSVINGSKAA